MCKYEKAASVLPDKRKEYMSAGGFSLVIIDGYEYDTYTNSNGAQKYSVPSDRLNLPKGKCMKCGSNIVI